MAGSTFGKIFRVTTWGESHGAATGAVVDGCPAGVTLCAADVQPYMDRRRPGFSEFTSGRAEPDAVEILSGVCDGRTTGAPISMIIKNTGQNSGEYDKLKGVYRPGHADYAATQKYGIYDHRGGGRFSGRETAGRVMGGAVASKFLAELGVKIRAYTVMVAGVHIDKANFDLNETKNNPLYMPDKKAYEKAAARLRELMSEGDSAGGIIECVVSGLKPGVGEPVFDKLDALLSSAVFSIGGVKGVEIGSGFAAAAATGITHNDGYYTDNKKVVKNSNNAGGVTGGLSDGADIIIRAAVKPTPSVFLPQRTVNDSGGETTFVTGGRHDPVIAARAAVVAECMAAIVVADLVLQGLSSNIENVKKIYL